MLMDEIKKKSKLYSEKQIPIYTNHLPIILCV